MTVLRIHFGLVRDRCADLGIREGDVLRCVSRTPTELLVELAGRGTAVIEHEYAHFVELAPEEAPGRRRTGTAAVTGRPRRRVDARGPEAVTPFA